MELLYCKNCGCMIKEGDRFCAKCSAKLDIPGSVMDARQHAIKQPGGDFNPDTVNPEIDLSLYEVFGFRLTQKLYTQFEDSYYTGATIDNQTARATVIRHSLFPDVKIYQKFLSDFAFNRELTAGCIRQIAERQADEVREHIALCKKWGVLCPYEETALVCSAQGVYHLFVRLKPVQPLIEYIKSRKINTRDCIRLALKVMEQLEPFCTHQVPYGAIADTNLFIDEDGKIYLGARESAALQKLSPDFFIKSAYEKQFLPSDTPAGGVSAPSVDIYSVGMLLFRMLNGYRHPNINAYQGYGSYDDYLQAEKARGEMIAPQMPFFAQNTVGSAVVRACSPYAARFRTMDEFRRILENSLNLLPAEELNRVVIDYDALSEGRLIPAGRDIPRIIGKAKLEQDVEVVQVSRAVRQNTEETTDNKKRGVIILTVIIAVLAVILSVLLLSERGRDRSFKASELRADAPFVPYTAHTAFFPDFE